MNTTSTMLKLHIMATQLPYAQKLTYWKINVIINYTNMCCENYYPTFLQIAFLIKHEASVF